MKVAELFEAEQRRVVAILPGRFHPFHKGHASMYNALVSRYGRDNVWIATSNKVELPKSPFTFSEKLQMMQLAGIPADRVIETKNPYAVPELTQHFNPASTVLIFAVSNKDMDEDPRFSFKPKKDGSAGYLQPLKDIKDAETMSQHGYITTVPTLDFKVLGNPMRSATQVRADYAQADDQTRKAIIKDLFGGYNEEVKHTMDTKLAVAESVNEGWKQNLAAAAVAISTATTPAQAGELDALIKIVRSGDSISRISKDSVAAELEQEIKNQMRTDASSKNSTWQGKRKVNAPMAPHLDFSKKTGTSRLGNQGESVIEGVGRIVPGVNTTADVGPNELIKQAKKFGNKVDKDGRPPVVKTNGVIKAFNLGIMESLYKLDKQDPMLKSEVHVKGVGVYSIETLHKNLSGKFAELAKMMSAMSPFQAEQAHYLLQNSALRVMLDSLTQAYKDLETKRSKGGTGSRGIAK
jgi:tellurite resistance protein